MAGLIAANNNTVGIRGVADNAELVCVDWDPNGSNRSKEDYVSYLDNGNYLSITNRMIKQGVCVTNNSWGRAILSKEGFIIEWNSETPTHYYVRIVRSDETYNAMTVEEAYDEYVTYEKQMAQKTATGVCVLMCQLAWGNNDGFLIVQSAGNGFGDNGMGCNVNLTGHYRAINRTTYDALPTDIKKNISYETIRDHLLIVGAVENRRDDNGNYYMTSFSNFGDEVDICAPGEYVYSTVCNNEYMKMSGTSMAAPIVAGSAALIWSNNPDLTAAQIKECLTESSRVRAIGVGDGVGRNYPMLHIGDALQRGLQMRGENDSQTDDAQGYISRSNVYLNEGKLRQALVELYEGKKKFETSVEIQNAINAYFNRVEIQLTDAPGRVDAAYCYDNGRASEFLTEYWPLGINLVDTNTKNVETIMKMDMYCHPNSKSMADMKTSGTKDDKVLFSIVVGPAEHSVFIYSISENTIVEINEWIGDIQGINDVIIGYGGGFQAHENRSLFVYDWNGRLKYRIDDSVSNFLIKDDWVYYFLEEPRRNKITIFSLNRMKLNRTNEARVCVIEVMDSHDDRRETSCRFDSDNREMICWSDDNGSYEMPLSEAHDVFVKEEEPKQLTEDEAMAIARDYWDMDDQTSEDDSGFETAIFYDGLKQKEDGTFYHSFRLRWLVTEPNSAHWSTIDFLAVDAVTGECFYPN